MTQHGNQFNSLPKKHAIHISWFGKILKICAWTMKLRMSRVLSLFDTSINQQPGNKKANKKILCLLLLWKRI